ncbi:MAG: YeeE/YedE family protein [Proteobacteria bacterium]|nr:YeeE/YedE family protein [Pseudomonadota bacterium]
MSAAIFTVIAGALFGFGLALSGMIRPEVVLAFLQWQDFGLMLVMGGGLALTLVAYQLVPRWRRTPLLSAAYEAHTARMQRDTFVGSALFGVGWGLSGVCPGPAIAGLGAGNLDMLWSLAGLAAGAWLQGVFAAPAGEGDWQEG